VKKVRKICLTEFLIKDTLWSMNSIIFHQNAFIKPWANVRMHVLPGRTIARLMKLTKKDQVTSFKSSKKSMELKVKHR